VVSVTDPYGRILGFLDREVKQRNDIWMVTKVWACNAKQSRRVREA
jgi:hypothetical protein